jgi:type VI secretion system protein ImpM
MSVAFGAFGKMPALGDFFQLNAPHGFVRIWDEWLQFAMVAGQQACGEGWDAHYMSAPIWRFTLAAGLAGPAKVMGVLMPSVDRVGRRFPLSLMVGVERDGPAALDHMDQTATFEQLEDIALAALDDHMDRDRLTEALAAVAVPPLRAHAALRIAANTMVMTQASADNAAPELAAGLIAAKGIRQPTLWTAILNDTSRLMICDGLPDNTQAHALFDLSAPLWADARPVI